MSRALGNLNAKLNISFLYSPRWSSSRKGATRYIAMGEAQKIVTFWMIL